MSQCCIRKVSKWWWFQCFRRLTLILNLTHICGAGHISPLAQVWLSTCALVGTVETSLGKIIANISNMPFVCGLKAFQFILVYIYFCIITHHSSLCSVHLEFWGHFVLWDGIIAMAINIEDLDHWCLSIFTDHPILGVPKFDEYLKFKHPFCCFLQSLVNKNFHLYDYFDCVWLHWGLSNHVLVQTSSQNMLTSGCSILLGKLRWWHWTKAACVVWRIRLGCCACNFWFVGCRFAMRKF